MASHHHLCHQPATTSNCQYCSPYTQCHHPPPPPPDCHLHPPPHPHFYPAQTRPSHLHQHHLHFQESSLQDDREARQVVSSLIRRVAALESALRRRCSSSSSHSLRDAAARTIQTHFRAFLLRRSRTLRNLKELASIKTKLRILKSSVSEKTHFDYDVIYQKAVDLLLKLDAIQGGDPMIREGKISIRRELNKFLDFIDGFYMERSVISSGVNVRYGRHNVKHRSVNHEKKTSNLKCRDLKSGNSEKLRELVERIDKLGEELEEEESMVIESPDVVKNSRVSGNKSGDLAKRLRGIRPKAKKSVTFADNGKVYRVFCRNPELFLDDDYDNDIDIGIRVNAKRDLQDDLCRQVEEIGVASKKAEDDGGVEAHSENEGSTLSSSDDEKDSRGYARSKNNFERKMHDQHEADSFAFSAPLPLKMEARTSNLIDKRKKLAE